MWQDLYLGLPSLSLISLLRPVCKFLGGFTTSLKAVDSSDNDVNNLVPNNGYICFYIVKDHAQNLPSGVNDGFILTIRWRTSGWATQYMLKGVNGLWTRDRAGIGTWGEWTKLY